jgi:hypothetical protein
MNNIEELKKAALGANLHGWTGFEDALNADGYSEAVSKFIGHCSPSVILALIAQLEAAQKEISELREEEQEWLSLADMHEHLNHQNNLNVEHRNKIHDLKEKLLAAEAALSAASEKLSKVISDDWNELGPTYPAHYTPVIVAMNGVTQYITYQIEEGDNGDYWQPVCNEDGEGAPMTQFQHWKPLPAGFTVEGE